MAVIEWDNFAVLDTREVTGTKLKDRLYPENQPRAANALPVETCARQVYCLTSETLQRVPQNVRSSDKTTIMQGRDAYQFMVSFYTGLISEQLFETHVAGQLVQAYSAHQQRHPSSPLKPYLDAVLHDGAIIRENILRPHLRRPSLINIALEYAQLDPTKKALVVCGEDVRKNVEWVCAMAHWKKTNPGVVYITHPDEQITATVAEKVGMLPVHRAISVPLQAAPFAAIVEGGLAKMDSIFVGLPMTDPQSASSAASLASANAAICAAWMQHGYKDGTTRKLLHLRGDPTQSGATTGDWQVLTSSKHGFVSRSDLKAEQSLRLATLELVKDKALEAVGHMAALRIQGDRLMGLTFNLAGQELCYKLARRQLGADAAKSRRPSAGNTVVSNALKK